MVMLGVLQKCTKIWYTINKKLSKIFKINKRRNNDLKGVIKSILCTWGRSIGS